MNFPTQLLGETVNLHNPFATTVDSSSVIWKTRSYEHIPYTHDIDLVYKTSARDFLFISGKPFESTIVQGKEYELTLSWYDFTATYYVRFDIDPALIIRGSSYNN